MTAPERWTEAEMIDAAARGVGKIDLYGARGVTLASRDEIEAMALVLASLGLRPVHPVAAEYAAPKSPTTPLKGPADD